MKIIALLLCSVLLCAGCAKEEAPKDYQQREKQLVLSYALEDVTYRPFVEAMKVMAKELENYSGGKITLMEKRQQQFSVNSDLMLETVMNTLDMCLVPVNRLVSMTKGPLLVAVPYLMRPTVMESVMAPGSPLIKQILQDIPRQDTRLVGVDIWYGGYLQFLMRDHQVLSPADLKDQHVWVRGMGPDNEFLLAMDAIPCEMSFTSGIYALRHGYLDGIMLPISMIVSNHLYENMHFLSITNHARMNYVLLFSLAVWDKLTQKEQHWVHQAAKKAGMFVRDLTGELEEIDLSRLKHADFMRIVEPDPDLFVKKADYVRNFYLKHLPVQAALMREITQEVMKHQAEQKVAEAAAAELRQIAEMP
ncbi:MAG: TRAP transporter substrate-binding protein DctP [Succinatimonas sp.]|nr:TRAP transporter substrate-binding protein DctP [Succinatimonas sp.]